MFIIRNFLNGKFVANSESDSADSYTNVMAYVRIFNTVQEAEAVLCPMNEEIVDIVSLTVTKTEDETEKENHEIEK